MNEKKLKSDFLEDDILKKCKKLYSPGTKFMTMATIPKLEIIKGIVRWNSSGKWIVDDNDFVIYEKYSNKFAEIVEEPKFEEGRWYKNYNPPNYMKCNKVDSNYMYGVEYISDGVYDKRSSSNSSYSWDLKTQTLVTDLSEIQQFLPEGHVDLEKYLP